MKLRLAIPHYCMLSQLEQFLPFLLEALLPISEQVEVVVVDDGSVDGVQLKLSEWCADLSRRYSFFLPPIMLLENIGKGAAVRKGWESCEHVESLAFVDADGSIPPTDVVRFIQNSFAFPNQVRCAIRPSFSTQSRSIKRQISGVGFTALANALLGLELKDPQCGFKIIPQNAYQKVLPRLLVNRFAFDCELLALLNVEGLPIVEIEIPWIESEDSTVNLTKDGFTMLFDIVKLRYRLHQSRNG